MCLKFDFTPRLAIDNDLWFLCGQAHRRGKVFPKPVVEFLHRWENSHDGGDHNIWFSKFVYTKVITPIAGHELPIVTTWLITQHQSWRIASCKADQIVAPLRFLCRRAAAISRRQTWENSEVSSPKVEFPVEIRKFGNPQWQPVEFVPLGIYLMPALSQTSSNYQLIMGV